MTINIVTIFKPIQTMNENLLMWGSLRNFKLSISFQSTQEGKPWNTVT